MIEKCIDGWHDYIFRKKPGALEELIAEDCVFLSPVVFTPQVGRDITIAYLTAAGGTLGGISSGQDLLASIALKPTSSITKPGKTIDKQGKETEIVTKGRHDPCVGLRATPIAEAMVALVLADAMAEKFGGDSVLEMRRNYDGYLQQLADRW